MKRIALLGLGLSIASATGVPARSASAQSVPSPEEFHGYELGTQYTITAALYDYYRALASASPRVEYMEYGRAIQGRPLPMVLISSETNLAAKDQIRDRIRQLTYVTDALPEAELAQLVVNTPAIVWIFIVDTDEEAGVEVLQEVAYDLATRDDATARSIRDNLLVIMTPLTNPDSHARYVTWHKLYNVRGAAVDPNAVENRAHWGMNTDGNAFGIDVNRDFGWFVTPEMSALARAMGKWHPQLTLDVHSGPTVIFLPPFPPPYHALWPDEAPKWWNAVAQRAGERFGRRGWSFNTREGYEGVTSVGFGLSWGMLSGAVSSFLFETFGGRPGRTTAFRRADGTLATMRMAMDRHEEGIWSLLQVASERKEELLRDAHSVTVQAVSDARAGDVRAVVIPANGPGVDPDKVSRLIDRLTLQNIVVRRLTKSTVVNAADYYGSTERRTFAPGSYVVDLAQPQARLARALLDPTIDDGDPQVLTPYTRRMPYYDVTWELMPLIFGVPAYTLDQTPPVGTELVQAVAQNPGVIAALDRAEPPYAYILPAEGEANYRVAISLLQGGYRLRVFRDAFRIADVRYPKGTWAAIRQRNPDGLSDRLAALVREHGGHAIEVAGPFTDEGVAFGNSARLAPVPTPLVAVVADWPVSQDHVFGGIRSVLETDFGFAFTPVMLETINNVDLSKYTAVVLPHAGMDIRGGPGFSRGYRGLLNMDNLRRYVTGGGTLIAVQGAGAVVAEDDVLGRDIEFDGWAQHTNGAILRATWQMGAAPEGTTTWRPGLNRVGMPLLASGYTGSEYGAPGAYPVLLRVADSSAAQVVARFSPDTARVSLDGFMLDEDRAELAGRPFVVVQPAGRGRVIYFASDPTFRGYWYGLNTLFLNALVLGPIGE